MKKLSDIRVDYEQILDFARVHSFDGNFDPLGFFKAPLDSAIGFPANMIFSKGNLSYSFSRTLIQYDCEVSPDFTIILQAFLYLQKYPEAQKMLWHYLTGNGEVVEVDTNIVFSEDFNLKNYALSEIQKSLASGSVSYHQSSGLLTDSTAYGINFKQYQYSTEKWKMAFGAINIRWEKTGSRIFIWFDDIYDWHPNEPRADQCVHMAMDRVKKYGAKEFYYYGTKLQFSELDFGMINEKAINKAP